MICFMIKYGFVVFRKDARVTQLPPCYPIIGAIISELAPSDIHRGFESWAGHTNS
jgi:hypothetical protein